MEHQPPPFFKKGPSPLARLAFFATLSVAAMVADSRFHYLNELRQGVSVAIYPLQQVLASPIRFAEHVWGYFSTQDQLLRENAELKRQLLEQSAQVQHAQSLQAEYEHLLALVEARRHQGERGVVAEVVHTGRNPFSRKVLVNKGSNSRIRPGMAVIDGKGVVGQVTAVGPFSSEVTLLTDKGQAVPVMVSRNGLRAIVFGAGRDGTLDVPFMPANADIQVGDLLLTSGIDGTYPRGLAVGTVSGVEQNAAYVFSRITALPAAGPDRHRFLLVLTDHPADEYPRADAELAERPDPAASSEHRKPHPGRRP